MEDCELAESHAADSMGVEVTESGQVWPAQAQYDMSEPPCLVSSSGVNEQCESVSYRGNFFRSAQWSPDGATVLALTEDRTLRLYGLPDELTPGPSKNPWKLLRAFPQPDAIYSYAWYPSASVNQPATFCFLVSVRDGPLRLVDAADGRIRATYSIVDHRERFVAPSSLAFSPDASKIYCGFESAIEVFDVASPGNEMGERLKTRRVRQSKNGQRGIISALAFTPDYSGTYAAGTFSGSVSLYSEDMGGTASGHLEGVSPGGVTQMAFHPLFPTLLYIASRRSDCIELHDSSNLSFGPVVKLPRSAITNQRLGFAIEPWGRWLATGDEFGKIHVFDIANPSSAQPVLSFQAHEDAIGAVHFHPTLPLLLSCSGSRVFPDDVDESESSGSDSDSGSDHSLRHSPLPVPSEASLKLWRFSVLDGGLSLSPAVVH